MKTQLMAIQDEDSWLEKRKNYVNSTESSSLFGLQMPALPTAYELWHIKRGLIESTNQPNPRMLWGKRLEEVIAKGIAEDYGWRLNVMKAYAYDNDDRIGSSYDFLICYDEINHALMEVKTISHADYKKKFTEDDASEFIEAPAYYEIQAQHELEVMQRYNKICLAVFILDTREVKLLWRDYDAEMGAAIRKQVKNFWDSEQPPAPDLEADSDLLARLHKANSHNKTYDATEDNDFELAVRTYLQETAREKAAKTAKNKARSTIILSMEDCNTAWCNIARVSNKSKFQITPTQEKENE